MARRSTQGFIFTATVVFVTAAHAQTGWYVAPHRHFSYGVFDNTGTTVEQRFGLVGAGSVAQLDDKVDAEDRSPRTHASPSDQRSYKDCKIVFTARATREMTTDIYSINADGTGLTHLTKEMFVYGLSWSPHGETISFTGLRGEEGMKELGKYGGMFAHWRYFRWMRMGEI